MTEKSKVFYEDTSEEEFNSIHKKRQELAQLISNEVHLNVGLLIETSKEFLSNILNESLYDSEATSIAFKFIEDVNNITEKWERHTYKLKEKYEKIEGKEL